MITYGVSKPSGVDNAEWEPAHDLLEVFITFLGEMTFCCESFDFCCERYNMTDTESFNIMITKGKGIWEREE